MSKPPPPVPFDIAEFEIVRRLGAGGMAEVFLAKKLGAEGTFKLLVLKRILPAHGGSRRFRTMFIEEARLATRLNHPNVVQVYEFQDFGDEGLLLAMEYVEGCDLGRLMRAARAKATRVPPWVGAWVIAEAAKGLHYAHEKRDEAGQPLEIVHRDVSPQNILLSFEGAVKIADFGIASARVFSEELGVLKGKFGYMSPEQARGETVDRRSDIYALGVVFWELLAGRPLHGGLGGEALLDIVRSGLVEPVSAYADEVPAELQGFVTRALHPSRDGRFVTARELSAAIGRALVKQGELVDASSLEATLGQLAAPDARGPWTEPPATSGRADDARTQAAAPLARSGTGPASGALSDDVPSPAARRPFDEARREVRHVAVLRLRLHGAEALRIPRRMLDRLRGMLDDLAFKRGMRWVWSSTADADMGKGAPGMSALAIAGLAGNPSRAANDAAQLALDVHETIAGFKDDHQDVLAASIGIARGLASGDRDAQGHLVRYALHEPAALLAEILSLAALHGTTWVAGGIYRLVRRDFRWGELPALRLEEDEGREIPAALRVYALERSLSREERLDSQGSPADLVGREAEKSELRAAFHQAVSNRGGAGQLVCRAIVGEMGIGKSALATTFGAELAPNARVLMIECTPVTMEVPHAAVAELVRQAVGTTGDEPFEQVAGLLTKVIGAEPGGARRPDVARLSELATNRATGGDAEGDAHAHRKQILAGVRSLLGAICVARPIVLVLESVQWCDKASLEVFGEFVHGGDPLSVLVLLIARPDDRLAHLFEGIVRVELRGLSPDEQVRLVETRLSVRSGARPICADLLPKVGGNPFFLLEMIDALLERGALEIRDVEGSDGAKVQALFRTSLVDAHFSALPSTLEQLVGDRLRELPPAEHAVIDWLAIAGGPLSAGDIVRLTQAADDANVGRLCARGVCDRKGELVDFRHPITREVAYASLDRRDRARMHRSLGEHLAGTSLARGLSAAIVARHLARGLNYDRAAHFYAEAGAAARSAYQTRIVIRYYQRAASYLGPLDRRRLDVHEALEGAYRMLGQRRERRSQLAALRAIALHLATPRAACIGLLRSARYEFDEGHLARGVAFAEQAARIARTYGLPVFEMEAEARVGEFLRELGDMKGALAACDRALAAFDPGHTARVPPRQLGEVIRMRGTLLVSMGRVADGVDAYADAIAIFRKCGGRRLEARAKGALSHAMFVRGRYEDAIALALESIRIDVEIGVRFQIARALTQVGQAYYYLGDAPRALAYLKRAREVHERYGDQNGWAETLLVNAAVCIGVGDLAGAGVYLKDASALVVVTGNALDKTHETVLRALIAQANLDFDAAVQHAMLARRAAENMGLVGLQLYAMAIEASARAELGQLHAATLLSKTALGALEGLQGCEYGLEIRTLSADALGRAGSPIAQDARRLAAEYAGGLGSSIRDERLRSLFENRGAKAAPPGPGEPPPVIA